MNFGNSFQGRGDLLSYEQIRPLLRLTYAWMLVGLLITSAVGFLTMQNITLRQLRGNTGIVVVAFIAELALVLGLSWALPRLSTTAAAIMFTIYAALNGFTLSVIALMYTGEVITSAFVTTALLFGALSLLAFMTNVDLTKMGGFLLMGLIGLLIAMVVNVFLRSDGVAFIINIIGVLIFTGLTAYDTQKIKNLAAAPELQGNPELMSKLSIRCALILYLDFINLFLFILRLMGRRR